MADAGSKVHKVCQVEGPLISELLGFEELVPGRTARTGSGVPPTIGLTARKAQVRF